MSATNSQNSLYAGDSATLYFQSAYYPPSSWTAQFIIGTPDPTAFAAVDNNDGGYRVDIAAADTESLAPGVYSSANVFSQAPNQRKTVPGSFFFIFPNPLAALAASWARTTLTAVESALATLATSTNSQTSVNGQTFTKQNINSLLAFRDRLIAAVGAEDAALGRPAKGQSRTIRTRFVS